MVSQSFFKLFLPSPTLPPPSVLPRAVTMTFQLVFTSLFVIADSSSSLQHRAWSLKTSWTARLYHSRATQIAPRPHFASSLLQHVPAYLPSSSGSQGDRGHYEE